MTCAAVGTRRLQGLWKSVFPWGTLSVNVLASPVLGAVAVAGHDGAVQQAVAVGPCGALSTYSTFLYSCLRLVEDGFGFFAAANVAPERRIN